MERLATDENQPCILQAAEAAFCTGSTDTFCQRVCPVPCCHVCRRIPAFVHYDRCHPPFPTPLEASLATDVWRFLLNSAAFSCQTLKTKKERRKNKKKNVYETTVNKYRKPCYTRSYKFNIAMHLIRISVNKSETRRIVRR